MKTTKILGYLGLLASIIVGLGEYYLHYSPHVLEHTKAFQFFKEVPLDHLKIGHFLAVLGVPLYFAGYIHLYRMLKSGSENLARAVLGLGFVAFTVGGIWIGSRGFFGTLVNMESTIDAATYETIVGRYEELLEVLVQVLRVVVLVLSGVFVAAILRGGTYYKKWMALFNPILILAVTFSLIFIAPGLGKYLVPIAMNVAHFVLFGVSLYQLNLHNNEISNS